MSLLSYTELLELVEQGVIDAPVENINSSSIDLTLDNIIMIKRNIGGKIQWVEHDISKHPYKMGYLEPVLASSKEYFILPLDVSAEYKLKSSQARQFLNHLLAGWADAGWSGKLTLEFVNYDREPLELKAGAKAGQMIFHRHAPVPHDKSYAVRGRYNNQTSVTPSKGIR